MRYFFITAFSFLFLVNPALAADQTYFEAMIGKNQDAVLFRVVPLPEFGDSATVDGPVSVMERMKNYDRKLPFVSYSIRKPQEFENNLDRQVSQEAQKLGIQDFGKITAPQAVHIAARITNANLSYENRMVEGLDGYDRALDDLISDMPLDDVFQSEKRGVCRQFAALFEVILERIITTNESPYLKNLTVDEVVSEDLNHAYNVVYIPVNDRGRIIIETSLVEPIARSKKMTLESFDASDSSHDGLIAEFTGERFALSQEEAETLYWMIATSSATNSIMQKQAATELLMLYNTALLGDLARGMSVEQSVWYRNATTALTLADDQKTTDRLDKRYDLAQKIFYEVQSLSPQNLAFAY